SRCATSCWPTPLRKRAAPNAWRGKLILRPLAQDEVAFFGRQGKVKVEDAILEGNAQQKLLLRPPRSDPFVARVEKYPAAYVALVRSKLLRVQALGLK